MTEGIGKPIRLSRGLYGAIRGTYWAWPIDGYYDLHFVEAHRGNAQPDGSDVVAELIPTLSECRKDARAETAIARMLF